MLSTRCLCVKIMKARTTAYLTLLILLLAVSPVSAMSADVDVDAGAPSPVGSAPQAPLDSESRAGIRGRRRVARRHEISRKLIEASMTSQKQDGGDDVDRLLQLSAVLSKNDSMALEAERLIASLNTSSIQAAVRRNMIRGGAKTATVNIPKFDYLKKEMCKSEQLKQIIRESGCLSTSVVNRFCYGQCNSFFIPKLGRRGSSGSGNNGGRSILDSTAFRSCSFCRPKRVDWITVQLVCPQRTPAFKVKRIQIVKDCACTALNLD